MATITAGWARAVLAYATSQGMSREQVLSIADLDESLLTQPDARVQRVNYLRLWRHVEQQLAEPTLGLRLARKVRPDALGIVGFAAQASATLSEAIELFVEFYPLIRGWGSAKVVLDSSQVRVRSFASMDGQPWSGAQAEAALATQVTMTCQWLGNPLPLKAVHFQHAAPPDTHLHAEIFGCPVRFGQPFNELVLPRDALDIPFAQPDPSLRTYLAMSARVKLSQLPERMSAVQDVRDALRAAFAREGLPNVRIEQVAKELGTSARSLQRRLQDEGTTFQEVLDGVRQLQAMVLLRQPGATLHRVSTELGFSEPRALRRAMRRWLQSPPASEPRMKNSARRASPRATPS